MLLEIFGQSLNIIKLNFELGNPLARYCRHSVPVKDPFHSISFC